MIEFRTELNNKLIDVFRDLVGQTGEPVDYVRTFDDHIDDVPYDEFPYLVVNVRTFENSDSEIGKTYDLMEWSVHIYYMDITSSWKDGDVRRNKLVGKIAKYLQENRRIGNLEVTDSLGASIYVWDSKVTSGLFDSSGQDEDYSFVSELYLTIFTAAR